MNQEFTGFNGITTATLPRRFAGTNTGAAIIGTRTGFRGNMLQLANTGSGFKVPLSGAPSTIYVGMRWAMPSAPASRQAVFTLDAGAQGVHARVYFNSSTQKFEMEDVNQVVRVTSPTTFTFGNAYWLEFKFVVHDSAGVLEFKYAGTATTTSSLDTKAGSATGTDTLMFGNNNWAMDLDDFYCNDSTGGVDDGYWGEGFCDRVDTSGDDAVQFTPLSGTNESNIDDANSPDDDTTYNASSTAGHVDSFPVSGYTAPGSTILGFRIRSMAKKTDAGSRTYRNRVKSGSTVTNGTTQALTTGYAEWSDNVRLDPNTAALWANDTDINACKLQYEIVA